MKKYIIGAGLLAGMMLLSGCGQPSPNGGLVSIHGKSYNMPSNTGWRRAPLEPIEAVYLASNGMNCRGGSVVWFASSLKNQVPNSINGMSDFAIKMHKQGKSGCSNPLSDKQYTYLLRQQNQRAANARANAQMQQQEYNQISNSLNTMSNNMAIQNAATINNINNMNNNSSGVNTSWANQNSSSTYRALKLNDDYYSVKKIR